MCVTTTTINWKAELEFVVTFSLETFDPLNCVFMEPQFPERKLNANSTYLLYEQHKFVAPDMVHYLYSNLIYIRIIFAFYIKL